MAKKTYRTYRLKGLQLLLPKEDGSWQEVVFRGGIQIDSTAKLSTSDEWLQNQLESLDGFNRDYYLESVEEKEEAKVKKAESAPAPEKQEEKPLTDVKDIKRFHNLVEMRNYMAELGFDGVQEMNYAQCKAAASKEGYDFQIQKSNN